MASAHEGPPDAGSRGIDYVAEVLRYLSDPSGGALRVIGALGPEERICLSTVAQLLTGIVAGPSRSPENSDDELVFTQFMGSFSAPKPTDRGAGQPAGWGQQQGGAVSAQWGQALSGVLRSVRAHQAMNRSAASAARHGDLGEESRELLQRMEVVGRWSEFDVFDVSKLSGGRPLQTIGLRAFKDMNLVEKLDLPEDKLRSFLADVEAHYPASNQYHNNLHVADVTQGILAVLSSDNTARQLTDLEILAMLIAALIHDVNHPGVNNSFLVQQGTEEAMLYNDMSVNEHGHISLGFRLLHKPENNFLCSMTDADYRVVRRLVIELVLGTDMACHQGLLATFATSASILGSDLTRWKDEDRVLLLKFIMHTVDISNPARSWPQCLRWANLVTAEFFCQGDREREAGMHVSPLYDRDTSHPVKNQQVFCDLFVKPTFQALSHVAPTLAALALQNCADNGARYAKMLDVGVLSLPASPPDGAGACEGAPPPPACADAGAHKLPASPPPQGGASNGHHAHDAVDLSCGCFASANGNGSGSQPPTTP
ncbi:hypothetical protein FOA52_010739 [Chlamydomonas sp. UWO 241]|nr:hypothetical protein FOA52_010739 [Chlamydomonas sp. UWO 241]